MRQLSDHGGGGSSIARPRQGATDESTVTLMSFSDSEKSHRESERSRSRMRCPALLQSSKAGRQGEWAPARARHPHSGVGWRMLVHPRVGGERLGAGHQLICVSAHSADKHPRARGVMRNIHDPRQFKPWLLEMNPQKLADADMHGKHLGN